MSFTYLLIKKNRRGLALSVSAKAHADFSPTAVALWLSRTLTGYRREGMPAEFCDQTLAFLVQYEKESLKALSRMTTPAQLLMESVLLACEMPARSDLDANLKVISSAYAHAMSISTWPVPVQRIRYSIRKHRDSSKTRLMTVYGDVMAQFGLEGCGLVLTSLSRAVGRDLGVTIAISNAYDIFGEDLHRQRKAPTYSDFETFTARTLLVAHAYGNLTLPYVKENLGALQVIADYFQSISVYD